MSPVRLLPREEWERKLRHYGCEPLEGLGPLNTAEWWRWPWGGVPFTVPVEADGRMDEWALRRIESDMAKLAPPDWEFPDEPFN